MNILNQMEVPEYWVKSDSIPGNIRQNKNSWKTELHHAKPQIRDARVVESSLPEEVSKQTNKQTKSQNNKTCSAVSVDSTSHVSTVMKRVATMCCHNPKNHLLIYM